MKKIEILIVEDEPKLAQTLTDFLRIQNYEVLHAIAGGKALDIFRENKKKIDLVLLDLMLPDISGYTVLKEIRKLSEVPSNYLISQIGSRGSDERIRKRGR